MKNGSFYVLDTIKQIGNASKHGFALIDKDHKILWINKTLEDKGFNLENIKGSLYYHTFDNKQELDLSCSTAHALETGRVHSKIEEGGDGKKYSVTSIPLSVNGAVSYVLEVGNEMPEALQIAKVEGIETAKQKAKEVNSQTLKPTSENNKEESTKQQIYKTSKQTPQVKEKEPENNWQQIAIQNTFDSIFLTDNEYKITCVNETYNEIKNYTNEDAVGEIPLIFSSSKKDPGIYKEFWKTINQGENWEQKSIGKKKDGTTYPVDIKIIPIKDDLGFTKHYLGIEKNLGSIKTIQEELSRYKTLPDSNNNPVLQIDYEGNITLISDKAQRFFCKSLDEKSIKDVLKQNSKIVMGIKSTGKELILDKSISFGGKEFQLTAIDIPSLEVINLYFSDITRLKEIEHKLRSRKDELERFYKLAVGREIRMIELKKKIKVLEKQLHLTINKKK